MLWRKKNSSGKHISGKLTQYLFMYVYLLRYLTVSVGIQYFTSFCYIPVWTRQSFEKKKKKNADIYQHIHSSRKLVTYFMTRFKMVILLEKWRRKKKTSNSIKLRFLKKYIYYLNFKLRGPSWAVSTQSGYNPSSSYYL